MLKREITKFEKLIDSLAPSDTVIEQTLKNGLSIRVTKTGKKVFQGRYTISGKRKRHDHGYYPKLTVKQAFEAHSNMQNNIDEGLNPFLTDVNTVFELFEQWYTTVGKKRKRPESARALIDADIRRTFSDIKLTKIKKTHFMNMFLAIQKRGSETQAERTRVLCKQVMKWSAQLDYIDSNPIADITGSAIGYKYKPRDRFLNDEEIGIVWNALDICDMAGSTINAIRIMMLTGLRRSEPFLAKWEHVDFDNRVWHIPAQNNKSNRANDVMLPDLVIEILKNQKSFVDSIGGSIWLFPNIDDAARHSDPLSVTRAVRRHCEREFYKKADDSPIPSWTPHALRHTFETKLTEIGIDYVTMKKMLNHEIGNMSGVYNHAELRDRKLAAMEKWCDKIINLASAHI
jgi:integrase